MGTRGDSPFGNKRGQSPGEPLGTVPKEKE